MEQYIHTLVSVDYEFVPDSPQVATFFNELVSQFKFRPICDRQRFLPGLVVAKPSGRLRSRTNPITGEKVSITESGRSNLGSLQEIQDSIDGAEHYTVSQSGEWVREHRPIVLLKTDGVPYDENYTCTVSCELRPSVVSTSDWDGDAGPNIRGVPAFGSECNAEIKNGIFPNPWTGDVIEVADAGCARFWIEFEFGKFIYPKVTGNFDVMSPQMVLWAEHCFHTKFVQGCRFW